MSRTLVALVVVVALSGLFASPLADLAGGEVAATEQRDADVSLEPDADLARGSLTDLEDSALIPAEIVQIESGDGAAVPIASFTTGDLGQGETITILRPAARRQVDIVVADGLAFTGFSTTLTVPAAVHGLQVDMVIDGSSVFAATVPGGSTEELTITLDTPIVTDTVLEISVAERFSSTCVSTSIEPTALELAQTEFFFEGVTPQQRTIADFFPPVLDHVIVVMDPAASSSVRSAAYELAAALARRFPTMPSIDVVHRSVAGGALAGGVDVAIPVSDDLFTRTIVLTEADVAKMSVLQGSDGQYLEIAGPNGLLEEMAAVVSDAELAFVTKSSVRVEELLTDTVEQDLLGQRSLRDVGIGSLETSGARVLELPLSLPQSAFGEPIDELRVHLEGIVVAPGSNGHGPHLTLWLNGELKDSIDTDDSGRFDVEFVVDASQIERDNLLMVRSELPLECGDELPNHDLSLDAASWVDPAPGQSLPSSLDRFPQVAIGHFAVVSGNTENELETAMTMVGVLQGSSPLPMRPQAVAIERVVAGFSAALVVTDGRGEIATAMARDLTTIQSAQLAFVSGDGPEDLAFASTSVTATDQDVLVVFSPGEELSQTFAEVATTQGWSVFTGSAVGVRGDGDLVRSPTPVAAFDAALDQPLEAPWSVPRQLGLGAMAATVFVVVLVLLRSVFGVLRRLR